jgi:hypothetical protein
MVDALRFFPSGSTLLRGTIVVNSLGAISWAAREFVFKQTTASPD